MGRVRRRIVTRPVRRTSSRRGTGLRENRSGMQPLHQLLSRIRWDPRLRAGKFAIGYYDRIERRIRVVPLERLVFPPDDRFVFTLHGEEGELLRIPFHRVRRVYRDGRVVWERRKASDEH